MNHTESLSVIDDILTEWERGKIDTQESIKQLKAEFKLNQVQVIDTQKVLMNARDVLTEVSNNKLSKQEAVNEIKNDIKSA